MNKIDKSIIELSTEEKKVILHGLKVKRIISQKFDFVFSGNHVKFGYYSDPHVGHKMFCEKLWIKMITFFKKEGINVVYCPGDNLEGMSNRDGHIYELSHIGASAQINYASQLFSIEKGIHFYIIDGNHDIWYGQKSNIGLVSGQEISNRCSNVHFLGEWEADVEPTKGLKIKLFHGNDGSAYAASYKIQKLIESLSGGKKPNLILSGHYHKQIEIFTRNVFGFECGTLCGQTRWMRGKKLAAHMGFGIIEIWIAKHGGIERLSHQFFPSYD